MRNYTAVALCVLSLGLSACANQSFQTVPSSSAYRVAPTRPVTAPNYASRIPSRISTGEKVVVIDPNVHVWGAYGSDGSLIRAGLTTAGGDWCPDIGRRCHTRSGSFRVQSLGSASCKSTLYPLPHGGAPMPYCMFFNGSQGLHGSYEVVEGNISHGCVRLPVSDAEWLRFNFINVGTKVVVKPY